MRRRIGTGGASTVRARLVAQWRAVAAERVRDGEPWLVRWERLHDLEAGAPVVLDEVEAFGRGDRAPATTRWFLLTAADELVEVVP